MKQINLLVINPNTGTEMTGQIEKQLKKICPANVALTVETNVAGPVSIEGHIDEIVSAYHMLELIAEKKDAYDGYLVACFSNHPSIAMLRELTGKPVVGIAEGACHMASVLGNEFAIVTTSPKWVPMLTEAVELFGLKQKCSGVFTSGLSVEDLHKLSEEKVEMEIIKAGQKALNAGAEVLCLGCAGMSGMQQKLEEQLNVPVVDSCEAGFMMLYALCSMGLKTSRRRMYEKNMPRETRNLNEKLTTFYKEN